METINLQIQIFILLAAGWILAKKGILDPRTRSKMTSLVMDLILPAAIIQSFIVDITAETLKSCLSVLMASVLIQVLYFFCMKGFWKCVKDRKKQICLEYATMVSNAGFMGMPIAQAAFGAQGLLYASIFLIPQRICMWSTGLSLFAGTGSVKDVVKKVALHPCIVALYIGLAVMVLSLTGIELPAFASASLKSIGNCSTALSMFVIGAILSEVPVSELKNTLSLLYSLLRLLGLPFIISIICRICGFTGLPALVCIIESAMPAPSTVVMLADRYDKDPAFASKLVFASTLLSLVTLPLWIGFGQAFWLV